MGLLYLDLPESEQRFFRITFVRSMFFDLQLSAHDLFSLGWESTFALGSVSKLVNMALVRADATPVS